MCSDNSQPRVHWIKVHDERRGSFRLIVFALAVGIAVPIGLLLGFALLHGIRFVGIPTGNDLEVGMPMAMGFVLPLVAVWAVRAVFRVAYRGEHRSRLDRLTRIVNHPQGVERLAGRVVEYHLRRYGAKNRQLTKALRRIVPGHIIITNAPGQLFVFKPVTLQAGFEPISITDDSERLHALVSQAIAQTGLELEPEEQEGRKETAGHHSPRRILRSIIAYSAVYAWIPFIVVTGYRCVFGGIRTAEMVWFTFCILMFVVSVVVGLMAGREWWLVPGGLLCRDHRLWRSQMEGRLVTTEDSSFLVDMSEGPPFQGKVAFVVDGKLASFHCSPAGSWGIVAGLLSHHHRPSTEELESFLGAKME